MWLATPQAGVLVRSTYSSPSAAWCGRRYVGLVKCTESAPVSVAVSLRVVRRRSARANSSARTTGTLTPAMSAYQCPLLPSPAVLLASTGAAVLVAKGVPAVATLGQSPKRSTVSDADVVSPQMHLSCSLLHPHSNLQNRAHLIAVQSSAAGTGTVLSLPRCAAVAGVDTAMFVLLPPRTSSNGRASAVCAADADAVWVAVWVAMRGAVLVVAMSAVCVALAIANVRATGTAVVVAFE